jgi:hypothetical protein
MNQVQRRFAIAKVARETAEDAIAALRPDPPRRGATVEELEAYAQAVVGIQERVGYTDMVDAYIEARDELLAWGKGIAVAAAERYGADSASIANLYERAGDFPNILEKVIDATMRVDA